MTDNEIVKYLESLLDTMRAYESSQASIGKGFVEDIISMYYRQKAKIAVLSVENANSKICVEDLNAELENKNVELVGMRGACESYKMHYDNAQAEIENKNVEIDILIRKKKTLRDEISGLSAEVEELKKTIAGKQMIIEEISEIITDTCEDCKVKLDANKVKSEAIRDFVNKYKDHIKSFTGMFSPEMGFMVNLDAILSAVDFVADNLVKEMVGDDK